MRARERCHPPYWALGHASTSATPRHRARQRLPRSRSTDYSPTRRPRVRPHLLGEPLDHHADGGLPRLREVVHDGVFHVALCCSRRATRTRACRGRASPPAWRLPQRGEVLDAYDDEQIRPTPRPPACRALLTTGAPKPPRGAPSTPRARSPRSGCSAAWTRRATGPTRSPGAASPGTRSTAASRASCRSSRMRAPDQAQGGPPPGTAAGALTQVTSADRRGRSAPARRSARWRRGNRGTDRPRHRGGAREPPGTRWSTS
jgi:hypothetical protein